MTSVTVVIQEMSLQVRGLDERQGSLCDGGSRLFSYGHVIRCITTKEQTCSRTSSTRPFLLSRTDTWKHSQVRSHCVGMHCALLKAEMVMCDRTRVGYRDQRGSRQRGSREACFGEGVAQCSVDRTRRCSSRMVNFSICQEGNLNEEQIIREPTPECTRL